MAVTLEEAKRYLRVEYDDEDDLISALINTANELVSGIGRFDSLEAQQNQEENASAIRTAILYTIAYLYEHREDANHLVLTLTIRALLEGVGARGVAF